MKQTLKKYLDVLRKTLALIALGFIIVSFQFHNSRSNSVEIVITNKSCYPCIPKLARFLERKDVKFHFLVKGDNLDKLRPTFKDLRTTFPEMRIETKVKKTFGKVKLSPYVVYNGNDLPYLDMFSGSDFDSTQLMVFLKQHRLIAN